VYEWLPFRAPSPLAPLRCLCVYPFGCCHSLRRSRAGGRNEPTASQASAASVLLAPGPGHGHLTFAPLPAPCGPSRNKLQLRCLPQLACPPGPGHGHLAFVAVLAAVSQLHLLVSVEDMFFFRLDLDMGMPGPGHGCQALCLSSSPAGTLAGNTSVVV
jgi:hypothetical protein